MKLDRLYKFVNKRGHHEFGMALQCWSWTGCHDEKNRPRFKHNGQNITAKRAYFEIEGQHVGDDDHVIQLCSNKDCIRPEHIVVGTKDDVYACGPWGAFCPNDILGMKFMYEGGDITYQHIAGMYGVSLHVVEKAMAEGGDMTAQQIHDLLLS